MFKRSLKIDLSPIDKHIREGIRYELYKKIRVLLLINSDPELKFFKNEIEKDKNITVIGLARNAHEARNMIKRINPDLIIMDILGPHSGGIEFLKRLNHFYPRPVLLVSSVRKMPFHLFLSALDVGVKDIVDKDALIIFGNTLLPKDLLISKIKKIVSDCGREPEGLLFPLKGSGQRLSM